MRKWFTTVFWTNNDLSQIFLLISECLINDALYGFFNVLDDFVGYLKKLLFITVFASRQDIVKADFAEEFLRKLAKLATDILRQLFAWHAEVHNFTFAKIVSRPILFNVYKPTQIFFVRLILRLI